MTNGQLMLLIFAAILAGFLVKALWEGETAVPVVADRHDEPKLFWSSITFQLALILMCLILPLVT